MPSTETQRLPLVQAPPAPHVHCPPEQPSAPAPHARQATLPAPHWLTSSPAAHVVGLEQQPAQPDEALHTQPPFWQSRPAPHFGPAPHLHSPPAQLSATRVSHAPHVMLPLPQTVTVVVPASMQVRPEQQPLQPDVASQTQPPSAVHRWPGPHAGLLPQRQLPSAQMFALGAAQVRHVSPPVPQAVPASVPGRHVFPWQQPLHDAGLHSQAPASQYWPG